MDILFHVVTGIVISKAMTKEVMLPVVVSAVLPDIIGATLYQFYKSKQTTKNSFSGFFQGFVEATRSDHFYGKWDRILYQSTHSWFALIPTAIIFFLFFPLIWIPMLLSYFSHLLIDLPTHHADFSQRPLYPFSDWHIVGIGWAKSKKIFVRMWLALLVVAGVTFITL